MATGVLFGLAPALRASRVDLTPSLKQDASAAGSAGHRGMLLSKSLMAVQVAMSTLLLVVAGLFVRTLENMERSDGGYSSENVLLMSVNPTLNQYEPEQMVAFYDQALEQLRAIPGVRVATVGSRIPLSGGVTSYGLHLADKPSEDDDGHSTFVNFVGPDFSRSFEIPVLAGRTLRDSDADGSPMVAVVNEHFVAPHFPGESVIGRRFGFDADTNNEYEIVGVVGDVAYQDLRDREWEAVHLSYAQHGASIRRMRFIARVAADPAALALRAQGAIRAIDPDVPVFEVRTHQAQRETIMARERNFAQAPTALGALALLLACVGLYGILSYSVLRRTREIGVRIALGARSGDVLHLVARELLPVLGGIALGLGAAALTTGWLESLLFGLTPLDLASLALATAMLTLVAGIAAWLPARRASRVDPVIALRSE